MTLLSNQTVCNLISKGYFAQAKGRLNNLKLNLDEVDVDGRTPLILCAFIDDVTWSLSLARFTLQLDASISKRDFIYQMNVLHYCCILERRELLELLLESVDFDINAGDCYGNTPLLYAITVNSSDIIALLMKFYQRYKITVDKTNIKGISALMQACLIGNRDLISQLLDMGANENLKDAEGKSAAQYKEEAISKSDLLNQVNENRRQSRMVRFDDIELIVKLQQETVTLQQNALNNYNVIVDYNVERVKDIKMKIKPLKRNKIDFTYVSKSLKSPIDHNRIVAQRNESIINKMRPKTATLTSQAIRERGDWYSIVGPLYVSLEQQYATSFRSPHKYDDSPQSHESFAERYKNRGRRFSRSIGSLSRKNSFCGKLPSDDDTDSVFITSKNKKRPEAITSAKALLRNLSKFGIRSSSGSLNNL